MPHVPKVPAGAEGAKAFSGDQPPADGPNAQFASEPGVSGKAYDVDVMGVDAEKFQVSNVETSNKGFDGPIPAA